MSRVQISCCLCLSLLGCWCASDQGLRPAYTIWLGSFYLNHTGTVLDVEVRWPSYGMSWFLLRSGEETNNLFRADRFTTMPERDTVGLTAELKFVECVSGAETGRTRIKDEWCGLGYIIKTDGVTREVGERYRLTVDVANGARDTKLFSLHAWVVPGERTMWRRCETVPAIITTYQAHVCAPVGAYPP